MATPSPIISNWFARFPDIGIESRGGCSSEWTKVNMDRYLIGKTSCQMSYPKTKKAGHLLQCPAVVLVFAYAVVFAQ
jgi:hypothetical protein